MEINIQFVKMPTSEFMEEFALKELKKLNKKYDFIIKCNVFYKLENNPTGKGKICEIQLSLPGPRIFAMSDEESFELATDETIRDLKVQLEKRKKELKPFS
ncbi:MAG: HPF/RaiA family ribosome-associated protein [Flavobacteriaceae bacterium]|nr:HPF/RaiA family ribosome-associated protein [Flavobacteriaceae bacterium]